MDQARVLFQTRVVDIVGDITEEEFDRLFDDCKRQVSGSQEAFEIWNKLFDEFQPR